MKTAIILADNELDTEFYLFDGDLTRFDGIRVNSNNDSELESEIFDLIYQTDGSRKAEPIEIYEFRAALLDPQVQLIEIGWIV